MDYTEERATIVNINGIIDDAINRLPTLTPEERLHLTKGLAFRVSRARVDEATMMRFAGFIKKLPFSAAAAEGLWEHREEHPDAAIFIAWNMVAAGGLEDAVAFHKHIARHLVGCIGQTKMGAHLPKTGKTTTT